MNRTLLPLILIIISITAFFMWINPHYQNVKTLQSQLAESNDALAKFAQLDSLRASLVDKENALDPAGLDKLKKLLPDNIDNIQLFLDIQGVASRYGTSIGDISVPDQSSQSSSGGAIGPTGSQFGQMALAFSVNTSYDNLLLFLGDLEKSLRIVEIRSIAFASDDANPNTYKVTLGINAFWLNTKIAPVAISQ